MTTVTAIIAALIASLYVNSLCRSTDRRLSAWWRLSSGRSPERELLSTKIPSQHVHLPTISPPRLFSFCGAQEGRWRVLRMDTVSGESLPWVKGLTICPGEKAPATLSGVQWHLRGLVSNERYVTNDERRLLVERQQGLGRDNATLAALIPIRKKPLWWSLTQEERRRIFEQQSDHIKIGLKYLPAVARRLHHCRDLGEHEPFDFLTWFEYAPEHAGAFDDLVGALRNSPEWTFVEREIDIRVAAN